MSSAVRDLYEILGVPRDASDEEIKRSYRRQARELHPDAGGDEEHFKELTTAYEVLKNPQARANYDRFGDPRGPGGVGDMGGFGDLSDLIDAFFGGFGGGRASAGRTSNAGRDAMVDVVLTLEEAAEGGPHDVDLTVAKTCDTCDGSGAAPGTTPVRCQTCGGQGAVQQVRNSVFGQMLTTTTCPTCRGTGQRIPNPCPTCRGEGRRKVSETVTVDVPAGADDGTRLRLVGRGEAGRNSGPAGDLYVRIRVRPHELFTRDGNNLHCELRIPVVQAALGAQLTLPTLYGEQEVGVPAGTQSGDVLTLRRLGMPRLGGGGSRGNLHVHCKVLTPTDIDEEQESLLRRLAELRGETARELADARYGLFGRLREAFGG
ncbi:MAG: molecular chaperone DnaJ [Nitriliruptorales bacterium]|nr:molecular chaperone DnaJ [Nitriliruptorales bacterium]